MALQLVRQVLAESRTDKLPGTFALAIIRPNPHAGTYISKGK